MTNTFNDPIVDDIDPVRRAKIQEDFGRHLVEQRNRMAALVRKWIETDAKFPVPLYDRLLARVRKLDDSVREDVASISLLMADQIVRAILTCFARGDDMRSDGKVVNYAIVAQSRSIGSDVIIEEVDVNRGEPVIAIWDQYSRWLSRYAPSDVRAVTSSRSDRTEHG
jgi:hypothetical protein